MKRTIIFVVGAAILLMAVLSYSKEEEPDELVVRQKAPCVNVAAPKEEKELDEEEAEELWELFKEFLHIED